MKFSIIIPAHNSSYFIERALKSVKEQTYTDYELIVVCDACTDPTAEIARKWAHQVAITAYGNDGLARNAGLDIASGEYVLFMDDDDWWLHEYVLQQLADRLNETSLTDILCFAFVWKGLGYTANTLGRIWPNVWSKCWRREFIGDTRFTDVKMESDLYFTREMMAKVTSTEQVDIWPMPLYYYNYMRPGSQTEIANRSEE